MVASRAGPKVSAGLRQKPLNFWDFGGANRHVPLPILVESSTLVPNIRNGSTSHR